MSIYPTNPSDGIYSASVSYSIKSKKFSMKELNISRINKYGEQAYCILD